MYQWKHSDLVWDCITQIYHKGVASPISSLLTLVSTWNMGTLFRLILGVGRKKQNYVPCAGKLNRPSSAWKMGMFLWEVRQLRGGTQVELYNTELQEPVWKCSVPRCIQGGYCIHNQESWRIQTLTPSWKALHLYRWMGLSGNKVVSWLILGALPAREPSSVGRMTFI